MWITACPKRAWYWEKNIFMGRSVKSSYKLGLLYKSISSAVFIEENDRSVDITITDIIKLWDYGCGL